MYADTISFVLRPWGSFRSLPGLPVGQCLLQVKRTSCRLPVLQRSREELVCTDQHKPLFPVCLDSLFPVLER